MRPFPVETRPFPVGISSFRVETRRYRVGIGAFPVQFSPFPVGTRQFLFGTRPFRLIIRRGLVETRSFRVEKRSLSLATDAFNNDCVARVKAVDGKILLAKNILQEPAIYRRQRRKQREKRAEPLGRTPERREGNTIPIGLRQGFARQETRKDAQDS